MELFKSYFTAKESRRVKSFKNWLFIGGATLQNVDIVTLEGYGRCIVATKHLCQGETPICIPESLCITPERAWSSDEIGDILCDIQDRQKVMAIFLIHEKYNQNSFWKPYIDILPTKFSNALHFTHEEAEYLQGTHAAFIRMQQKHDLVLLEEAVIKLYEDYPKYFPLQKYNRENLAWALSVLKTRAWYPSCLCPGLDLISHHDDANRVVGIEDLKWVEVYRDTEPGQQIFVSYGTRPSAKMLGQFGFLPQRNPCTLIKNLLPTDLFVCVQVLRYNMKILEDFGFENFNHDTLQIMQYTLHVKSRNLSTVNDVIGLQDSNLSFNKKNALRLRIQEKQAIEACQQLIAFLLRFKNEEIQAAMSNPAPGS